MLPYFAGSLFITIFIAQLKNCTVEKKELIQETIKLECLTPYIPYNLNGMAKRDYDYWEDDEGQLVVKYKKGQLVTNFLTHRDYIINRDDWVKPFMRPMKDIINEIEHDGEKFTPKDELKKITNYFFYNSKNYQYGMYIDGTFLIGVQWLPYQIIIKLLEWHFDIFELIDKDLAADINLLDEKG